MLYTSETKQAMKLCFEAHKNQIDKSGLPYVFHPFHVAEQMSDEDTIIVALLHDVVEDTEFTLDDLRNMGFGDRIIDALFLMTHDKAVPYLDYVWKIRCNPIARAVKQADLQHNSDLSRLDNISAKDKERVLKYKMASAVLGEHKKEYDGTYRVTFPLDDKRLFFLSMFYTENGPDRYSLDAEYAEDVHYTFSANDAERIRAKLPKAESLPEAMSKYLGNHDEEDFAALLVENHIPTSGFHFYDYNNPANGKVVSRTIPTFAYRFSATGIYGVKFFESSKEICSVTGLVAPNAPLRMFGWGLSWETGYDRNITIVPGQRLAVVDSKSSEKVAEIITKDFNSYILKYKSEEVTVVEKQNSIIYLKDDVSVASFRKAIAKEAPAREFYGETAYPILAAEFTATVSNELKLLVLAFPCLGLGIPSRHCFAQ